MKSCHVRNGFVHLKTFNVSVGVNIKMFSVCSVID